MALTGGYHGDTIGSVSVGGIDLFHRIFKPLLFDVHHAPQPYCYRCPLGKSLPGCAMACAGEVERILEAHAGKVAALVVEPLVQGADGMITQPPGYLRRLREACDRHGVLLVCDEVATGFGRTGTMFAVEQEGVRPDIMTVAKGITGGYLPLAATLTTEEIFESFLGPFEAKRTFFHGHTYAGNPLACAAATASMRLFTERSDRRGAAGQGRARWPGRWRRCGDHPNVGEIRQRGLMVGVELVQDRASRAEYDYALRIGHQVCQEARPLGGHPAPARQRGGAHAAARHDRGASSASWRASRWRRSGGSPRAWRRRRSLSALTDARPLRHRHRHRGRQDRGLLRPGGGGARRRAGPRRP